MEVSQYANVNWTSLAAEALKEAGLDGITPTNTVVGTDGNLTMTFTGADGKTATLTMPAPELDEATGTLSEEGLEALEQKINNSFAELQQILENPPQTNGTGTSEMLFDIYNLMQLMLEVAKKQKEVSVAARQADLARVTADIQSKASMQRSAAKTGLIMSVCFSVISIAAQAGSAAMSFKSQNAANKMEAAVGADQAQKNLQLLSAQNTYETGANLANVQKGMSPTELQRAQGHFASSEAKAAAYQEAVAARDQHVANQPAVQEAKQAVATKQAEIDTLKQEIATLEADQQQQVPPAGEEGVALQNYGEDGRPVLEAKRDQLTAAEAELGTLKAREQAAMDNVAANDPQFKTLNDAATQAKADWADELNLDQSQLEAELGGARTELMNLEGSEQASTPAGKQQIADLKTRIASLEKQAAWGKAHVVDQKMQNGMSASLAQDIANADHILDQKTAMLKYNAQYKAANASAQGWNTASELIGKLGMMLNSVTQGVSGMKDAAATEFEATAKSDEAAMNESADLVSSARDLQRTILELLQQVLAAENQSINQIVA